MISRKKLEIFYGKNIRANAVALHCLVADKFDFMRKIVELFLWKKFVNFTFWFYAVDNFDLTRKTYILGTPGNVEQ